MLDVWSKILDNINQDAVNETLVEQTVGNDTDIGSMNNDIQKLEEVFSSFNHEIKQLKSATSNEPTSAPFDEISLNFVPLSTLKW